MPVIPELRRLILYLSAAQLLFLEDTMGSVSCGFLQKHSKQLGYRSVVECLPSMYKALGSFSFFFFSVTGA
jgi:hypothetical protein